jgi:uncharacterized membrane protein (DUF485 family)
MSTTQPGNGRDRGQPPAGDTGPGVTPADAATRKYLEMEETEDFAMLRKRYRAFAFPMTAAFLAWYLLFVLCSSFAKGFMSTEIIGNINVAFVFGILQFVTTFLIAWLYTRYANEKLDPLADELKHRIEGETA